MKKTFRTILALILLVGGLVLVTVLMVEDLFVAIINFLTKPLKHLTWVEGNLLKEDK